MEARERLVRANTVRTCCCRTHEWCDNLVSKSVLVLVVGMKTRGLSVAMLIS